MTGNDRANAPVALLAILGVLVVFQLVLVSAQDPTQEEYAINDPDNTTTFGFNEDPGIFGVLGAVWGALGVFFNLLTFQFIPMPGQLVWVPALFAIVIHGSLAWRIIGIITRSGT